MRLTLSALLVPAALVVLVAGCRSHRTSSTTAPAAVHISGACVPGNGCVNCTDCACDPDEVAVSGGGFCGPNVLMESGNQYGHSNVDRVLNVWRVGCTQAPPANAYALCMKATH